MKKYTLSAFLVTCFSFTLLTIDLQSAGAQKASNGGSAIKAIAQRAHTGRLIDVAVSSDGKHIVTAGDDSMLKIWDSQGRLCKNIIALDSKFKRVGYQSNSSRIYALTNRKAVLLYDRSGTHLKTLSGDAYKINLAAVADDGNIIVTTEGRKSVDIRDDQWAVKKTVAVHNSRITCMDISPDGSHFITGSDTKTDAASGWDTRARLWDKQGNLVREIEMEAPQSLDGERKTPYITSVVQVKFSPDGSHIAVLGGRGWVHIRKITGELVSRFEVKKSWKSSKLFFTSDGRRIVVSTRDAFETYELAGSKIKTAPVFDTGERGQIGNVDMSPDGALFVAGVSLSQRPKKKGIKIFNGEGNLIQAVYHDDIGVTAVGLAHDMSKMVFETGRGAASIVYSVDGPSTKLLAESLCFDADGKPYHYSFQERKKLRIWDDSADKALKIKNPSSYYFITPFRQVVEMSYGREEFVFFSFDGVPQRRIKVNKYQTGGMGSVYQSSFSPKGDYMIVETSTSHGAHHTLRRIQLSDGKPLNEIDLGVALTGYAISASGRQIATGHKNGDIQIWSKEGKRLRHFKGHAMAVTSLAVGPKDRYLISASEDNTIKLWEISTGRHLTMVLFKPDDWFVYDQAGNFDCSDGARDYVRFVSGLKIFESRQLWNDFYKPGLVQRFIKDKDLPGPRMAQQMASAPSVTLSRENQPAGQDSGPTVTLNVCADDNGSGVGDTVLNHNGRTISSEARGVKITSAKNCKAFTTELLPGRNLFFGAAYDRGHHVYGQSEPIAIYYQPKVVSPPEMYILSVGVSNYKDNNIRLKYPSDDARSFSRLVNEHASRLYKKVHPVILVDESAHKAEIITAMSRISEKAQKNDTVILYLAGHGETEKEKYYFMGYDTDITDIAGTALGTGDISNFVKEMTANKIAIFLDTCKSGSMTQALALGGIERGFADRKIVANLARDSGIAVFSAASKTQAAYEIPSLEHGIFTYCLIDAFENNTDKITEENLISLSKLLGVVNRATRATAFKYLKTEQTPIIYMFGDDFSIGKAKKLPKS